MFLLIFLSIAQKNYKIAQPLCLWFTFIILKCTKTNHIFDSTSTGRWIRLWIIQRVNDHIWRANLRRNIKCDLLFWQSRCGWPDDRGSMPQAPGALWLQNRAVNTHREVTKMWWSDDHETHYKRGTYTRPGSLFLTHINSNPSMVKKSDTPSKVWDGITYPFPTPTTAFHPTFYNVCSYSSTLGLKLIRVSKRGPWTLRINSSWIHVSQQ